MGTGSLIALLAIIVAAVAIYVPARQAIRRDRRDEEQYRSNQLQNAIDRACTPLNAEIDRLNKAVENRDARIAQLLDDRRRS